jgi:hypothetical protein
MEPEERLRMGVSIYLHNVSSAMYSAHFVSELVGAHLHRNFESWEELEYTLSELGVSAKELQEVAELFKTGSTSAGLGSHLSDPKALAAFNIEST